MTTDKNPPALPDGFDEVAWKVAGSRRHRKRAGYATERRHVRDLRPGDITIPRARPVIVIGLDDAPDGERVLLRTLLSPSGLDETWICDADEQFRVIVPARTAMTKALVGPLPRVHFRGGPRDLPWFEWPWVVYATPQNTLDPRYRACSDHRVACDCREAEFAEERGEWQALRDDVRLAEQLVAGHHEDCACTGCKMVRLMGHEYDPRWSRGRQPEPDVALVLRADAAKKRWHVHCRDPFLPGVCRKCRLPFPCRNRREVRFQLDDIAAAWPALVELTLMYVQPEERVHHVVHADGVALGYKTFTDALEQSSDRRVVGWHGKPLRVERRDETGSVTLLLWGAALDQRLAALARTL